MKKKALAGVGKKPPTPTVEMARIRIWREVLDTILLQAEVTPAKARGTMLCLLGCLDDDDEVYQVFEYLLAAQSGGERKRP